MMQRGGRVDDLRIYVPDAPDHLHHLRIDDRHVELVDGGPARVVATRGRPRNLRVIDFGDRAVPAEGPRRRLLVYADRFSDEDIRRLRDLGAVGIDRTGVVVVAVGGQHIVVGGGVGSRDGALTPRDADPTLATVRGRALAVPGGYGLGSIRLAQTILDSAGDRWTPTTLAGAGGASVATASRFLKRLYDLGLVAVAAEGRERVHDQVRLGLLADFLSAELDPVKRRERTASGYLRARSPEELTRKLARGLARARVDAVITGAAAAPADVAVVTAIPVVAVRIHPSYDLATAAEAVALDVGGTGANVRLIADAGGLGTQSWRLWDGMRVAPRSRVWLDLRRDLRGSDAAASYRAAVLDPLWSRRFG